MKLGVGSGGVLYPCNLGSRSTVQQTDHCVLPRGESLSGVIGA